MKIKDLTSRCSYAVKIEWQGREVICCLNKSIREGEEFPILTCAGKVNPIIQGNKLCVASEISHAVQRYHLFHSPNVKIELDRMDNCQYSNTYALRNRG